MSETDDIQIYRKLWQCVLLQAIAELKKPELSSHGGKITKGSVTQYIGRLNSFRLAINYFSLDNQNFRRVCHLAGFEPSWIIQKLVLPAKPSLTPSQIRNLYNRV